MTIRQETKAARAQPEANKQARAKIQAKKQTLQARVNTHRIEQIGFYPAIHACFEGCLGQGVLHLELMRACMSLHAISTKSMKNTTTNLKLLVKITASHVVANLLEKLLDEVNAMTARISQAPDVDLQPHIEESIRAINSHAHPGLYLPASSDNDVQMREVDDQEQDSQDSNNDDQSDLTAIASTRNAATVHLVTQCGTVGEIFRLLDLTYQRKRDRAYSGTTSASNRAWYDIYTLVSLFGWQTTFCSIYNI